MYLFLLLSFFFYFKVHFSSIEYYSDAEYRILSACMNKCTSIDTKVHTCILSLYVQQAALQSFN